MEWVDAHKELISWLGRSEVIHTLAEDVPNRILEVRQDRLLLSSPRAKMEPREIVVEHIRSHWELLAREKKLKTKTALEKLPFTPSAIIHAILARLPCVEYSLKPATLYLIEKPTHELGTTKLRRPEP